ncbi:MAG: LamG-like jellyroll fold domain-containing protein [Candidatus Poribacteria bacterium]
MKKFVIIVSLVALFSFSTMLMAQELVLYYSFDESGDKIVDKSGKGNDGAFDQGKGKRVASKAANFGQAMEFDALSRIVVKDSKSLTIDKEISFVMWEKKGDEIGGTGTLPRIFSRTSDLHELAMDSGNKQKGAFAIYFGNNPGWTACMLVDQNWHHIAVTGDGSTFHVYLDGEDVFQIKAAGPGTYKGDLFIGSRCVLGNESFKGWLDEVAVFAGVLSKDKVKQIMNGGVNGQLLSVSDQGKLGWTWGAIKAGY